MNIGGRRIPLLLFILGASALVLLSTVAIMQAVGMRGISYLEIIFIVILLILLPVFFSRKDTLTMGYYAFIILFTLGYRSLYLTPRLQIYPLDILIWALFLIWVLRRRWGQDSMTIQQNVPLPRWLLLLIPLWILAWGVGFLRGNGVDRMLRDFGNYAAFIPIFLLSAYVLQSRKNWLRVSLFIVIAGSIIALLGLIEYFYPAVKILAGDFILDAEDQITISGFRRGSFAYWGAPTAAFICVLALPFTVYLWSIWQKPLQRLLIMLGTVLMLLAIYIAGYRSVWILTGIMVGIFFVVRINIAVGVLFTIFVLPVIYAFFPEASSSWLETLFVFQRSTQRLDSSQVDRLNRATSAWQSGLEHPLGVGWAGFGSPHSDYLQMLAHQGWIVFIIFIAVTLYTLYRLWRLERSFSSVEADAALTTALLIAMVGLTGLMLFQGLHVLPQMSFPGWLVLALALIWIAQQSREPSLSEDDAKPPPETKLQPY